MSKNNYVDNKEFLAAIIERRELVATALAAGKDKPQISNYLGKCIQDICTHFSYRPNFINYSFREEMIGDAIENCLAVIDNFDPAKSSNPFAYFTQITFFAFLRRIQIEKKQQYIKFKLLEELPLDELIEMTDSETGTTSFKPAVEFMREHSYFNTKEFEDKIEAKKKPKTTLEIILEDVEGEK
jgi:hypothetical protein